MCAPHTRSLMHIHSQLYKYTHLLDGGVDHLEDAEDARVHLAREELGGQRVGREVVLHRHTKTSLYNQKRRVNRTDRIT